MLTLACGPSVPPLTNAQPRASALASAVLESLHERDADRLRALALDEREFREHVWPELPASRPERNLPMSYVWSDLHQKSEASLGRILAGLGGQTYQLVSIRFAGATTPYRSFLVHRQAVLTVKNHAGAQRELRVFGSVVEKNGRFKVFSYVVE